MKKFILAYFFLFSLGESIIFSNLNATTFEIWIENRIQNTDILIRFYPVGSLFNGGEPNYAQDIRYSLDRTTMNRIGFPPSIIFRRGTIDPPTSSFRI